VLFLAARHLIVLLLQSGVFHRVSSGSDTALDAVPLHPRESLIYREHRLAFFAVLGSEASLISPRPFVAGFA
jgi:hypothetical protein